MTFFAFVLWFLYLLAWLGPLTLFICDRLLFPREPIPYRRRFRLFVWTFIGALIFLILQHYLIAPRVN